VTPQDLEDLFYSLGGERLNVAEDPGEWSPNGNLTSKPLGPGLVAHIYSTPEDRTYHLDVRLKRMTAKRFHTALAKTLLWTGCSANRLEVWWQG
jgi:hypothetical protein